MFKSAQRLSRAQFTKVFNHGVVYHTPHFLIRMLPTKERVSRASVVVSKKVEKGAVRRHLLRRQLYNALRPLLQHLAAPHDLIVISKKGSNQLTFTEISSELGYLLTKKG